MINAYFENIREQIVNVVSSASESVRVALAYFTDDELFGLLCLKAEQGVSVELLVSDDPINFKSPKIKYDLLFKAGVKLFFLVNENNGLLHHKFCIVDNQVVLTGSYNWTNRAENNYENLLLIHDTELAKKFSNEFDRLIEISVKSTIPVKSFFIKTGFENFDKEYEGLFAPGLIGLIVNSNEDGSDFLLSLIAANKKKDDCKVLYASVSDTTLKVTQRLHSKYCNISLEKFLRNNLTDDEALRVSRSELMFKDVYILDLNASDNNDLDKVINKVIITKGLKLIVLEGLDRMFLRGLYSNSTKITEFQFSLKRLKQLTLQYNVCILISVIEDLNSNLKLMTTLSELERYVDQVFTLSKEGNFDIFSNEISIGNNYRLKNIRNRFFGSKSIDFIKNTDFKSFKERDGFFEREALYSQRADDAVNSKSFFDVDPF